MSSLKLSSTPSGSSEISVISGRGSGVGGGGGGVGEPVIPTGYYIRNLKEGLSLWLDGFFLNANDLLNGQFRFALYSDIYRVSEFDLNVNSDIDVFVVLPRIDRNIEEDLFDIAYDLELEYDCLIDIVIFGEENLEERVARTPFYLSVLSEGLAV